MAKYHINSKTLEPGKCSAVQGNCPFGGDDEHYTSMEAAREKSETLLSELNGWSSSNKRKANDVKKEADSLVKEISDLENSPARRFYGMPEDELIRYNIEKRIRERKEALSKLMPLSGFYHLSNSLDKRYEERGVDFMAVEVGNNDRERSWEKVMGPKARRTKNNIELYHLTNANYVRQDSQLMEEAKKHARFFRDMDVYARAYEEGVEIPERYAKEFDSMWEGDGPHSEAGFKKSLEELNKMKADYAAGLIKPAKIVGGGLRNPEAAVQEFFKNTEDDLNRALATKGRSDTVNVSNVQYRARKEGWEYKPFEKN